MPSIAVFNNKGGVGKTTLLCNLASYFALRKNQKVLVIDADPQCNATQSMLSEDETYRIYSAPKRAFTIHNIIDPLAKGKGYQSEIATTAVERFGVDLLPGDPRLALKEDLLSQDWINAKSGDVRGLRTTFVFKQLLSLCSGYDYVFIDVGPSLGGINRAVLLAAQYFATPMATDIFSLRAIENIGRALVDWRKLLENGLSLVDDLDDIEVDSPQWHLRYLGYVTQQYIFRRDADGNPQAVRAYDKIVKRIPATIETELVGRINISSKGKGRTVQYNLGSIPNLHSLVPMSQTSRSPIFELKGRDGVVGAHFAKVRDYEDTIAAVATALEKNIKAVRSGAAAT